MEGYVSIIIPIYNGKNYIDNIFEQIGKQTYKKIELIFVDDGSSDGSSEYITAKYNDLGGMQYCCMKLIRQKNAGQGAARNSGLVNASGEYIAFMDQDDSMSSMYIETLYNKAITTNADIVITGYNHVYCDGKIKEKVVLTNNKWCKYMNITPWGKLYKNSFIRDNNVKFLPAPFGEDIYFNIQCYALTRKVYYSTYVGYNWLINNSSVSNTIHKNKSDETNVINLFNELENISFERDEYYCYFLTKTAIYHILYVANSTPYDELRDYKNEIMTWLTNHYYGFEKNEQLSFFRPKGERLFIRSIVKLYMILYKARLDNALLKILSM
ncbi:Glycosyltransferase involved in cell wall bisynthesis [Pseudobutyrivibrio sp. JW11]|uniref:glycosyltransferase n=1 Tax=Pseudobutyrivibrio sp. JW11 TaxID=1855302 RepID=UPI0008E4460C|nr:glycosyltransferase [Pseudobutyrivibrio sp. JW11]SFO34926.1 Glycosyltransferase involved in cell wall bisynthesis [Pseudobutyrivibrio sp. JW11]